MRNSSTGSSEEDNSDAYFHNTSSIRARTRMTADDFETLRLMASPRDFDATLDVIRSRHGGALPDDWTRQVILSGVMDSILGKWGPDEDPDPASDARRRKGRQPRPSDEDPAAAARLARSRAGEVLRKLRYAEDTARRETRPVRLSNQVAPGRRRDPATGRFGATTDRAQ